MIPFVHQEAQWPAHLPDIEPSRRAERQHYP
jgi:hypothetical protein